MTVTLSLPFANSRALDERNEFFADAGVALDVIRIELDADLIGHWRASIAAARARLGWPDAAPCVATVNGRGAALAIAAPSDRLETAAEVNQWALCAALQERDPMHWCGLRNALRAHAAASVQGEWLLWPAEIEPSAALARFERLAAREAEGK